MSILPRILSILQKNYKYLSIIIIVIFMLIIGIIIVPNYGQSTDEYLYKTYAQQVLEIVAGLRNPTDTLTNLRYYGPVFSVTSLMLSRVIDTLIPSWDHGVAVHFTYFLSFLLGVVGLYLLCLRFTGIIASTIAVLLFASQPVLFGHAFINPKDIPFMGLFIVSMLLAFWASDAYKAAQQIKSSKSIITTFKSTINSTRSRWSLTKGSSKLVFLMLLTISGVLIFGLITGEWLQVGEELIRAAYNGESWAPVNALFGYVAQDAWKTSIGAYQDRLKFFYPWMSLFLTLTILTLVLRQANRVFGTRSLRAEIKRNKSLVLLLGAAFSCGLTTSIRVGGIYVAILVGLIFLLRFKKSAIFPLSIYGILVCLTTYATWPFLWEHPLARLIEVVRVMMDFRHPSTQLFEGLAYHSWELPRTFLPKMMSIQFTIPLIILFVIGIGVIILRFAKWKEPMSHELLVITLWFIFPMTIYLLLRTPIYNNFRQLFFITPPLFIIASLAIKSILTYMTRLPMRAGLAIVILIPGVIGIIHLHPYEYIYYNQFVGGVEGAKGEYHLDYLCSSYAEGMRYVNSVAEPNQNIAVAWEMHLVNPYAREDLRLYEVRSEEEVLEINAAYLIACTRFAELFPEAPVIYSVERDGGVLTTVKFIQ